MRQRMPWGAVLAAAGVTFLLAGLLADRYHLGPVDDAFISLRYADNWAAGCGLCFNPSERVEGYTNFLLVAVLAAAIKCGADPVFAMAACSRIAQALLAGVFTFFVAEHVFRRRPTYAALAGILLGANTILVCWATSGLESCLYALLLLAAVTLALRRAHRHRPMLSAVVLILAAMTRPEGAAFLPVTALAVYLRAGSARVVARHAAVFAIGFGLYFSLRAAHFGYLFPNTFYAKLDYGNTLLGQRGLLYVWDFARGAWPLILPALAGFALLRGAPSWAKTAALATALPLAITIYEGGDHFAMFRFMVPVLPFLAILALYPCVWAQRRYHISDERLGPAFLLVLAAVGASGMTVAMQPKRDASKDLAQFEHFATEVHCATQWSEMGRWLRDNARPDAALSTIAIGAIAYHSDLVIIDPHGIVDPTIAHQDRALGGGYAGHEKYDIDAVMARRPGYLLLLNTFSREPVPPDEIPNRLWGAFNTKLFQDPRLDRDYRCEPIRMGNKVMHLHVRRDLPTPTAPGCVPGVSGDNAPDDPARGPANSGRRTRR